MLRYIKDGKLEIADIEETVPESVRITLLQWISQAGLNASGKGRTEYGQEFLLKRKEGTCVLNCEDGALRLPRYVLEFR